jgi:hypothetical protein
MRYAARRGMKKAISGALLKRLRFEPQTLAVAAAVYGGFGLTTWYVHALPLVNPLSRQAFIDSR